MKRQFGDRECWLSIISTRRPQNVAKMTSLVGAATWYVNPEDLHAYRPATRRIHCTEGLSAARNMALDHAHDKELTCLMLDDDLTWMALVPGPGQTALRMAPAKIFEKLLASLSASPYRLGGISPTNNAWFVQRNLSTRHFVIGSCCAVEPTHLRYDESLPLKEDYDYTLQHIAVYGGVCRVDPLIASFTHYTNSGGAVDARTPEREQQAIRLLKARWGSYIQDNPRRPNEILLRVPRREILT
jgi:hypothetical protein